MSSSNDAAQMYKANVKPQYPDNKGMQYADDSMTPSRLSVSYDQYYNEQAEDRPMCQNSTPMEGSYNFSGGQYSDDWNGGYSNYGVMVNPPASSNSSVSVDVSRADRGKES